MSGSNQTSEQIVIFMYDKSDCCYSYSWIIFFYISAVLSADLSCACALSVDLSVCLSDCLPPLASSPVCSSHNSISLSFDMVVLEKTGGLFVG